MAESGIKCQSNAREIDMEQKSFHCIDECPNRDSNDGNCMHVGTDGEKMQCVDEWAEDKYYYLERYLNATYAPRDMYSKKGNAVYIDLFSGPGMCRIRMKKDEILGGVLRAVTRNKAPFNRIVLNDLSEANCQALAKRVKQAEVYNKAAEEITSLIVNDLVRTNFKYHFVYLDPFAPSQLPFSIIRELAQLKHLDVMIHFPIGPIRRNYKQWLTEKDTVLDSFLGTARWREMLIGFPSHLVANVLISLYLDQLKSVGFPTEGLGILGSEGQEYLSTSIAKVKNSRSVVLYYLILASKHKLAAKIWKSILKYDAGGQQSIL